MQAPWINISLCTFLLAACSTSPSDPAARSSSTVPAGGSVPADGASSVPTDGASDRSNPSGDASAAGGKGAGGKGAVTAAESAPNVLLIYIDDMGFADLGANKAPTAAEVRTPHLDSIAAAGVRFTNGYVSAPMCSPSRAGLVTGRYQQRYGYESHQGDAVREEGVRFGMPLTETTMAERMKAIGYNTYASGKWHMGHHWDMLPQQRGFDEYWGIITPGNQLHLLKQHWDKGIVFWDKPVASPGNETFLSEDYTTRAIEFIQQPRSKPFFIYLAYTAVHAPNGASQPFLDNHPVESLTIPTEYQSGLYTVEPDRRAMLLAYLEELDANIGRLLQTLKSEKINEDTLVFAISDNGGKPQNNASYNLPLRGAKSTLYEGGIHVPFLMQWPGTIAAGQVLDEPVIQLDVLPTMVSAAGVPIEPAWELDGLDLLPLVTGKADTLQRDTLHWRVGKNWAVRHQNWKLVHTAAAFYKAPAAGTSPELYNLKDDPRESTDLAAANPDVVQRLTDLHHDWEAGTVTPLWGNADIVGDNPVPYTRLTEEELREVARFP